MEVRALDESAQSDDAVMREFYELGRRSQLFGRPHAPFWDYREFLGMARSVDSGERQELFAAYDGDRMVGNVLAWSFLMDNQDKCVFQLAVDPPERRRGVGTALVERVEQAAGEDHRSMVLTSAVLPFDGRETHGYQRFAQVRGYELSDYQVVRHLTLPVPDSEIQDWIDEAAPHHHDYRIETFVGSVPDDLVESLCSLVGQLAVDAPSGLVDFEEEVITPHRYAETVAAATAMGRVRYETVALTPEREVVAQSTLALSTEESTVVFQWGTFVHREHRGHRLGLTTKAVNLRAVQASRDDLTLVVTQNGETNDYMVSINKRMGFRPIEVSAEFVKRIDPR